MTGLGVAQHPVAFLFSIGALQSAGLFPTHEVGGDCLVALVAADAAGCLAGDVRRGNLRSAAMSEASQALHASPRSSNSAWLATVGPTIAERTLQNKTQAL
jgi:hypothetical protein